MGRKPPSSSHAALCSCHFLATWSFACGLTHISQRSAVNDSFLASKPSPARASMGLSIEPPPMRHQGACERVPCWGCARAAYRLCSTTLYIPQSCGLLALRRKRSAPHSAFLFAFRVHQPHMLVYTATALLLEPCAALFACRNGEHAAHSQMHVRRCTQ